MLEFCELDTEDVYTYKYQDGSDRVIRIVFKNNFFSQVEFNFGVAKYNRAQWHVLAEINSEITKLEAEYEKKKK